MCGHLDTGFPHNASAIRQQTEGLFIHTKSPQLKCQISHLVSRLGWRLVATSKAIVLYVGSYRPK